MREPDYDLRIREDVEDELQNEPGINTNDINVTVHDGVVSLAGRVASYLEKTLAEEAALRVSGVRAVANEIVVQVPEARSPDDRDLTEAVAQTLRWHAAVPDSLVATVTDGIVTLTGTVAWQHERLAAERAVGSLVGVRGVINEIVVAPAAGSAEIQGRIERALRRSAAVDAKHIDVHAQNARILLRGTARSWAERSEAERIAWAAGAANVDNQIAIGIVGEEEKWSSVPSNSVTVPSPDDRAAT